MGCFTIQPQKRSLGHALAENTLLGVLIVGLTTLGLSALGISLDNLYSNVSTILPGSISIASSNESNALRRLPQVISSAFQKINGASDSMGTASLNTTIDGRPAETNPNSSHSQVESLCQFGGHDKNCRKV